MEDLFSTTGRGRPTERPTRFTWLAGGLMLAIGVVLLVLTAMGCAGPTAQAEAAPNYYRDAILAEVSIAAIEASAIPDAGPTPSPSGVCTNCNGSGRSGDGLSTCIVCNGTGRTVSSAEMPAVSDPAEVESALPVSFPFNRGGDCGPGGCAVPMRDDYPERPTASGTVTTSRGPIRRVASFRPLRRAGGFLFRRR